MARDVTFVVFQFFVAASLQVVTQAQRLTLLLTLIATALVSFGVTAWTPSIFSALFLPFFIGALPGTLLGEFIVSVFDRFTGYHANDANDAAVALDAGGGPAAIVDPRRGIGCIRIVDAPRFAPATLFVSVLCLVPLFMLPLAVSDDNLAWAIYVFAAVASVVYAAAGLLVRRVSHAHSRAWLILSILAGTNYVVMLSFIAFTGVFWSYLVYFTCIVLDAVIVLSIAPCASGDVQAALSSISGSIETPAYVDNVPTPVGPSNSRPTYGVTGSSVSIKHGNNGNNNGDANISIPSPYTSLPSGGGGGGGTNNNNNYTLTPEGDTAPATDNKLFDFFSIGRK